jgi:hypothetical protein
MTDTPWTDCMDGFKHSQEPYPDEMFEEAERREAANRALDALDKLYEDNCAALEILSEIERKEHIDTFQIAVCAIGKYSDALKELAKTEKEELKAELEAKKKENFQLVADACMKEYTKTYGEMPEDDSWMFLEAEYYGTGEGQTTCLMMTQANPRGDKDDFDRALPYPDNYNPITSKQYRAVRAFHTEFGTWYLHGLRFHTREAFFTRYANMLPAALVNLKDQQCFLEYHSQLHYNFG